jgi:hypothetical protein
MRFWAEPNKKDLRKIRRRVREVDNKVRYWKRQVPLEGAREYAARCIEHILTQKFRNLWPEYAGHYAAWKTEKVGHLQFWQLSGDLTRVLAGMPRLVYEGSAVTEFFSGIPRGIPARRGMSFGAKGGKAREILTYAMWMEYGRNSGTQYQPPRPLFFPTFREYIPVFRAKLGPVTVDISNVWR